MSYYKLRDKVIFRIEYFGGFLFDIDKDRFYELNKSAATILSAMEEKWVSIDTIATFYNDPEKQKNIIEFINKLADFNLLVKVANVDKCNVVNKINVIDYEHHQKYLKIPVSISYYPTYLCNQNCQFCSNQTATSENHRLAPLLSFDKTKIFLDKAIKDKVCILNIFGGEPTMHWPTIKSILSYVNNKMSICMVTNGSYNGGLTDNQLQFMSKLNNFSLGISIHSIDPFIHDKIVGIEGAWEISMSTAKRAINAGINVLIQSVAHKSTYSTLFDMAIKAKEIGAKGYYVMYVQPRKTTCLEKYENESISSKLFWELNDQLITLEDENFLVFRNYHFGFLYKNKPIKSMEYSGLIKTAKECSALGLEVHIDPSGDVYPCELIIGLNEYKLGNILEQDFAEIYTNKILNIFRERNIEKLENEKCIKCSYKTICKGGCPIVSKMLKDNYYAGDPMCPLINEKLNSKKEES